MRRLFICCLTLFSLTTFGQSDEDHLEPSESFFDMYDYERDYYPFIYKHLLKDLPDKQVVKILTLPSFTPENVLCIEKVDEEKNKFKVIYKVCTESIWYKKNRNAIEVIRYEEEIDSSIVNVIKRVFKKVLFETRYNEQKGMGLDGVTYIFSGHFGLTGTISGKIWSPNEGTKMNDLVEFGESMIALAKCDNDDKRLKFKKEIRDKGEKLLKRLNGQ